MALLKFDSVIIAVEYLRSYDDAVPVLLSSPGDVQFRLTEVWVMLVEVRLLMLVGEVVSGVGD